MNQQILDDNFHANKKVSSNEDIKQRLVQAGISSFYEHENGTIRVEDGDAVQVEIHYIDNEVSIKSKFPQIGNSIQIVISGIILAIFLFIIPLTFPIPWIIAILGGQLISYLYFTPKTKKLKERIERYI